eukprot:4676492-Prymnesium_polylepis.1
MDVEGSAMQARETDGSKRHRMPVPSVHANMLSGNPSHRSVCPRTCVPLARFRHVSYVRTYVQRAVHAERQNVGDQAMPS